MNKMINRKLKACTMYICTQTHIHLWERNKLEAFKTEVEIVCKISYTHLQHLKRTNTNNSFDTYKCRIVCGVRCTVTDQNFRKTITFNFYICQFESTNGQFLNRVSSRTIVENNSTAGLALFHLCAAHFNVFLFVIKIFVIIYCFVVGI